MSYEIIKSEFIKSMKKAISVHADKHSVLPGAVQICISGCNDQKPNYELVLNQKPVCGLTIKEVLFVNPVYKLFTSQIEKTLATCISVLEVEHGAGCRVLISESKKPGLVRLMLYQHGNYKCDISEEDILNLKKKQ